MILGGVAVGSAIGVVMALRIQMTAMPQMVALLNGFGGGASALVASAELLKGTVVPRASVPVRDRARAPSSAAMTFTGSLIAFAKLQELMRGSRCVYPGQQVVNGMLGLGAIAPVRAGVDPAHRAWRPTPGWWRSRWSWA